MIGRYTAGLLLLAVLGSGLPDAQAARDVAEQRECATCHIMWLKAFKREDVSTLIPYDPRPMEESGRTDVTSTSLMCLSCHDGFMLDSRSLWKDGHQGHPVGIEPPQAIAQQRVDGKNLFPLNDDGKMYCGTCHTAHGVDWEASDTPVFMRARSADGELCQGCHADRQEGPASGNHPVNVEVEQVPAVAGTQHLPLGTDGKVTCQSCHTAHNAAADKLLIVANENSQLCGACHEDQDVATLQMAAGAGTHPVNIVPLRAQVAKQLFEHGGRLGDDGQVICQSCHMPHQAQSDDGILIMENQDAGLCRACHQGESRVVGSRHDLSLTQATTADNEGVCSTCHVAHGGSGPKMWAREIPSATDPMSGLCLGCHATGGSAESHQVGVNSHPVGVNFVTPGPMAGLPTFSAQGVRAGADDIGMVSCASCHDPHQWNPDHPELAAEPGLDGDAGNSFLRRANDHDSVLCRECHEGKWQLAGTSHDLSTSLPGSTNAAGVIAGEAGMCGSCHRTHNGLGPAMWARDVPAGRAPVAVACLSCHGEQGPADARPADEYSHPVGVSIDTLDITVDAHGWSTEAPGIGAEGILESLPLYDDHGNAVPDGNLVGCGSCHDPHMPATPAGDPGSAGDETDAFLRLADRGRDGLCINCHAAKDVVRLSPHGRTELPEQDTQGVCLSCHRAHEGEAEYMWARTKGPGTQPVEQLCTSCHRNGGDANDRLTGENSHPLGLSLDEGGAIDCASCHDPHQWNPNDPLSREGLADGVEGDITTSFLKIGDANGGLCIQCHEKPADVLGTDHDLRITAIDATNLAGQSVAETGLCGQCHAVHNARLAHALWAREPGEGAQQGDRLCTGCHSRTGVANSKVPAEAEHPQRVTAWPAVAREGPHPEGTGGISVLHAETGSGKLGEIGCASCHNPHQWTPDKGVANAGGNLEGDVRSSFLRLQSTQGFLCADCHGKDALFRYLYFHSSRSRSRN